MKKTSVSKSAGNRIHVRMHTRIEIILRAVQELYPHDKSAPGLVLAWVPEKGFYASLVRYNEPGGAGKQRITFAFGKTLDAALKTLTVEWRSKTEHARKLVQL